MDLSAETLSRFQFGFTAAYHIMFPALSIGLAWFLVLIHALYLRTRREVYFVVYKFWSAIFAINFAVGVVTGIFMSFQFGLNWSGYAYAVGPVLGTIIGLEVLTAFFLEAGFLGIMLLGWNRVNPKVHFFATCMVAVGTLISATWIMGANSWMHTPAGFAVRDGQFFITDWWAALFNPSFFYRYPHMILASLLASSFLVAGVSAWYLLRNRSLAFARVGFSIAMGVATLAIITQIWLGDILAVKMYGFQPAKLQAVEGYWDDRPAAPYLLFIVPDQANQRNRVQWGLPLMGSILVTHSLDGAVPGLKQTPPDRQPNMALVFYSFRTMFLLGILMFIAAATSVILRFTGKLFTRRWFLKLCLVLAPAGVIATIAGWVTSEAGRQPYIVFGQLLTRDALSPLTTGQVGFSLGLFLIIYLGMLTAYITFLARTVRKGPEAALEPLAGDGLVKQPLRPPVPAGDSLVTPAR
jgi:cytochrome d ubiquinol oxidase subunit I